MYVLYKSLHVTRPGDGKLLAAEKGQVLAGYLVLVEAMETAQTG